MPGEPSDLDQFTKTLPLPKTKYFVTPDPPQNNHDHCCSKFIFYFFFKAMHGQMMTRELINEYCPQLICATAEFFFGQKGKNCS